MPNDLVVGNEWTRDRIELVKRVYFKGASDDEFALFLTIARRTGLSPEARQIYPIKRWNNKEKRYDMTVQASIDGLRVVAERSGELDGQLGPLWCGPDGKWVDVWLDENPPAAAKVGVLRKGCREPFWGVARFKEYVPLDNNGQPMFMWQKFPATMLAKCAEAQALRKAFPQDLSGLYITEEMQQADEATNEAVNEITEQPTALPVGDDERLDSILAGIRASIESYRQQMPIYFKRNPDGNPTATQLAAMKALLSHWLETLAISPQTLNDNNRDVANELARIFVHEALGHLEEPTAEEVGGLLAWLGLEKEKDEHGKPTYHATARTLVAGEAIQFLLRRHGERHEHATA